MPDLPAETTFPAYLPPNGFAGHQRIHAGQKPEPGRRCSLILGFDTADIPELEVWLNNTPLTLARTFANEDLGTDERVLGTFQSKQVYPKSSVLLAEFDAADAVVSGTNILLVKNRNGEKSCSLTWCEIEIAPAE